MGALPEGTTTVMIRWNQNDSFHPEVILYDPNTQEYTYRPLETGEQLYVSFSSDRHCIGRFANPTDLEPCPRAALASSGEQCEDCSREDFYWPMRAGYSDLSAIDPHYAESHIVYLALFGPEPKVGITHRDRFPIRVIEQGADMAMILCEADTIDEALEIESDVESMTSITDQMPKAKKTKLLREPTDIQRYEDAYRDVKTTLDIDIQPFDPIDFTAQYVGDSSLEKRYRLVGSEPVNGEIEAVRGQLVLLDSGQALNVSGHSGYVIEEPRQSGLSQF